MSSRKKKKQGDPHGSSRNLDGRRLRTITEAKNLAEYLALKPEMDKKEKEEKRKRWEQVVELAERKQDEIKEGGKKRLDGQWMEAKEEATEKTRDAVLAAIQAGEIRDVLMDSEKESMEDTSESSESDEARVEQADEKDKFPAAKPSAPSRTFYGWDEEELSDSSDEDQSNRKEKS